MSNLAVICGSGDFPFLFLDEIKNRNIKFKTIVIALIGETNKAIENFGFLTFWVNIGKLNTIIDIMKTNLVKKAVMCGKVHHTKLFTEVKLDFRAIKLLGSLINNKADTILGAVAQELKKEEIELISSLTYMEKWLPNKKGFINNNFNNLTEDEIYFAFNIAKSIAALDIGQTVATKDKAVIAVEGFEGTDECILRGYALAGEGLVIAKVNKPNQDNRFDVPVIGKDTFEILKNIKAKALVYESGKTLFFNTEEAIKIANENKISIFGV